MPHIRRRRRSFSPQVEALEGREVPSITKVGDIGTAAAGQFATSATINAASAVTANDTIIVLVTTLSDLTKNVTVTDSAGDVYTNDVSATDGSNNFRTFVFSTVAANGVGAGGTITVNVPDPLSTLTVASATEFSGPLALDRSANAFGVTATPSSGMAPTTSQANELLIGAIGVMATNVSQVPPADAFTVGAGYATLLNRKGSQPLGSGAALLDLNTEFQVVAATGAFQANGSLASLRNWAAALATFKAIPPLAANPVSVTVAANSVNDPVDVISTNTDPSGGTLSVKTIGAAGHGTAALVAGGGIVYTPTPGFSGTDSFTYTIASSKGGTATNTVTVTVTPASASGSNSNSNNNSNNSNNSSNTTTTNPLTLTAPKSVHGSKGIVTFRRLTIHDAGHAVIHLQVSATAGKLFLHGTGVKIRGNGTRAVTVTGSLAAVNKALATLTANLGHAGAKAKVKLTVGDGTNSAQASIAVQG
jgi:hypothetical protein